MFPWRPLPLPGSLVARPPLPIPKSKHHSYFEFVENKEKKKKLNIEASRTLRALVARMSG